MERKIDKTTLADLILSFPENRGTENVLVFLDGSGKEQHTFTFNALRDACLLAGQNIRRQCDPGEVILLPVGDQAHFVIGFFGAILAGCIPAPLPGFRGKRDKTGFGRTLRILRSGDAKTLLIPETDAAWVGERIRQEKKLEHTRLLLQESLKTPLEEPMELPTADPQQIAYIQYTSGSTSTPKGVVLHHAGVLNNVEKMYRVFARHEPVRTASWIPLHHDMGLVGHLFGTLFESGFGVFMPPVSFLARPENWFQVIHDYRANTSAAPTFAFDLCARKVTPDPSWDLSCYQYAFVGAEMVSVSALDRFCEKFQKTGFQPSCFKPVYGMAEATLLAAGGGDGYDAMKQLVVEQETGNNPGRRLLPYRIETEGEVCIHHPESGAPLEDGLTGEIYLNAPGNSKGYFSPANDTLSEDMLVKTGDMGFIKNGFLYITGRKKELIIVRGVNYPAEDLEHIVQYDQPLLQSDLRSACVADFSEGTERFVVFQEADRHSSKTEFEAIAQKIQANLLESLGINAREVVLIPKGLIPKTQNFKIARTRCLSDYRTGKLRVLYTTGQPQADEGPEEDPVVVVGMACRFPGGANSPEQYWELLSNGVDAITEVPPERWDNDIFYVEKAAVPGKLSTKWAGFTDRIEQFDPMHFGISPYEAPEMDPQHRMLMETSWRLIENVGWKKEDLIGSDVGVFVGLATNDYLHLKIKLIPGMDSFNAYSGLGNANSVAANRLSYFYDFKGPSLTVDTACSSSLTALHIAHKAVANGECTQAIAGGVNALLSPGATITLSQFGMMSPEGRCKTFDASADGYVRAEGCGLVMLKKRSAALRDGDRILATLLASNAGQDGASKGITSPNGEAQRRLIERTLKDARLTGEEITYVEAHGTGTPTGDPVEVEQIAKTYGRKKGQACYMGSVKANVGHLEAGAGIASVIKTLLMLQHQQVPPQIHVKELNSRIHLDQTRLKINNDLVDWQANGEPRRCAVSSFGFGGSLAHAIFEGPSKTTLKKEKTPASSYAKHFVLSASTAEGLPEQVAVWQDWFEAHPKASLEDVCYTQALHRSDLNYREYFLASNIAQLQKKLERFSRLKSSPIKAAHHKDLAFVFTGQGEQYENMALELYQRYPVFKDAFDRCAAAIDEPESGQPGLAEVAFNHVEEGNWDELYLQPTMFAIQYGIGMLWQACGIVPNILLGHSLGEYAAACLAGCFEPETGMKILQRRAALVEAFSGCGQMATIFTDHRSVAEVMDKERVSIAAINSMHKTVISGDPEAVEAVIQHFKAKDVEHYHLLTRHAFHSYLLEPMMEEFHEWVEQFTFHAPVKRWVSSFTGMEMDSAPESEHWVSHLRETVQFGKAVACLKEEPITHFIEIGPGASTLVAVRENLPGSDARFLRSLNKKKGDRMEGYYFADSIGQLYTSGYKIRWGILMQGQAIPHLIPGIRFMHRPYWINGVTAERLSEFALPGTVPSSKMVEEAQNHYQLHWTNKGTLPQLVPDEALKDDFSWIIVGEGALAETLYRRLKTAQVISFWVGTRKKQKGKTHKPDYILPPNADHSTCYKVLEKMVFLNAQANHDKWRIVYITHAMEGGSTHMQVPTLEQNVAENLGFFVPFLQALQQRAMVLPLWVVTDRSQFLPSVDSDAAINLNLSPLWGFSKTLFLEHPEWRGGLIDVDGSEDAERTGELILRKILKPKGEHAVAIRKGQQFIQQLVPKKTMPEATFAFRNDGACLITGGLGGLGLSCAAWAVKKGCRHLILMSRRSLPPKAEWMGLPEEHPGYAITKKLIVLEAEGAKVELLSQDIRDLNALAQVFQKLDAANIPVRGVIHAAGVNWFSKIKDLDQADFLHTLRIKVSATWALHQHTLNRDLDCFLLFSSVSALWGSVDLSHYSAANHFMDMLSIYRNKNNLCSTCINWGPWADVGMSSTDREVEVLGQLGFRLMPPNEALNQMEKEVVSGAPLSLVADVDWQQYNVFTTFSLQPSLFDEVSEDSSLSHQVDEHLNDILNSPPEKAKEMIEEVIRLELRMVMLIESMDKLDENMRFNFLGMDSLMAISFAVKLEQYFGVKLPNTLVYNYPTIASVRDYLFELVYLSKTDTKSETSPEEAQPAKGEEEPVAAVAEKETAAPETEPETVAAIVGSWFRTMKEPEEQVEQILYCFPYAGSGASVYSRWATRFDKATKVVAIQAPGHEDRGNEPPFTSMAEWVAAFTAVFEAPDVPYYFYGHSLGANTAYECCIALAAKGTPVPLHLFLSGTNAPLACLNGTTHLLPEEAFIEKVLQQYENGAHVEDRRMALQVSHEVLRADVQVLETYQPSLCNVTTALTIIAGKADALTTVKGIKNWLTLADDDFTIAYIDGGHDLINGHEEALLQILENALCSTHTVDQRSTHSFH